MTPWNPSDAIEAMEDVQRAYERKQLPPDDAALRSLGRRAIQAFQGRDLDALRDVCEQIIAAAESLPVGGYLWPARTENADVAAAVA